MARLDFGVGRRLAKQEEERQRKDEEGRRRMEGVIEGADHRLNLRRAFVARRASPLRGRRVLFREGGGREADILAYLRETVRLLSSPRGSSIWRMLWAEADDPDVVAVKQALRSRRRVIPDGIVARCTEVAADVPADLLFQLPVAAVCHRQFFAENPVDSAYLEELVAVVVAGVAARFPAP